MHCFALRSLYPKHPKTYLCIDFAGALSGASLPVQQQKTESTIHWVIPVVLVTPTEATQCILPYRPYSLAKEQEKRTNAPFVA